LIEQMNRKTVETTVQVPRVKGGEELRKAENIKSGEQRVFKLVRDSARFKFADQHQTAGGKRLLKIRWVRPRGLRTAFTRLEKGGEKKGW